MKHITIIFLLCLSFNKVGFAANNLHKAGNITLLQHACPAVWEKVDKAIAPAANSPRPKSVPWSNGTDKNRFINFGQNFIVSTTKTGSSNINAKSLDVITVLSECIKRHNLVVRSEFGKTIGELPNLSKIIDISAIIMLLMEGE